jgi:hypothetical protein
MDTWTWITRAGVAAALVLSVGNTVKLVLDERRRRREDQDKEEQKAGEAQAERELLDLIETLQRPVPGGSGWMTILPGSGFERGAPLGVERGLLRGKGHLGRLIVKLTTLNDPKD